ncbi:phosphoglycerate mutase family protein [Azomonas macrocytogenes]|uniref:Broad specificity phosphatase PhoE n=1 Tax=Azomonas macrocytogenes TaxID=69962 RepID=A0A839T0K9_AZOMA|nr:phosphoglycerate mutase family protein [Azomonas macrocytogenes]MBB3103081.1 broad specificity phosphatase PhoE [Azomonas macrocytogenes]
MQIILVRHGKPDHHATDWCTPSQMKIWVEHYNQADVVPQPDDVPAKLTKLAEDVGQLVSSSQSRCVQSLQYLNRDRPRLSEDIFTEAHQPWFDAPFPRLPVPFWRFALRLAWFCGFSSHTESILESSKRAKLAAARLIELAEAHESVLLMGHGIMNILIAWQLRAQGWKGPYLLFLRGYWHASVYEKAVERIKAMPADVDVA